MNVLSEPSVLTHPCFGSIFTEAPLPCCRAVVVIPARNEQRSLPATLEALRKQTTLTGEVFPAEEYEVLVLLNNCTDRSLQVIERYASRYPAFALRFAEVSFPAETAHAGTARRLLMDCACERLEDAIALSPWDLGRPAILSTDADTRVAPDWLAQNLLAIEQGAEAVGGVIHLDKDELRALDAGTLQAYERDRHLQRLTAELEALLDPDPADPWPRHLEHFGASIACTPEVYRRCGGLPAVKPLEDVAFVDALRRAGARLRHAPDVHIYTSARLDGRAEIGLSGQLRHWRRECAERLPHIVESAPWLEHRFRFMGWLRTVSALSAGKAIEAPVEIPKRWRHSIHRLCCESLPTPMFLERLDCDRLIEETFIGERYAEVTVVLEQLAQAIVRLRDAPAHPA